MTDKILSGIKVVEMSTYVAGPMCSRVLGDWGADVIKVEYIDSRTSDFDFRESLDLSLPDFLRHALSKKFKHWQYEQEHRLIVPARKTTDLVFHPFSASFRLTDVMIGARSNLTFASIRARIKSYPQPPAIYKMKASPVAFAMEHLT